MYAQWIQSYRDLPILINQWCNVMRWELRTRLFLRTAEFLWQEGHTAHETADEAREETLKMLDVYADFAEQMLAIPVIKGAKTDSEKFPGAVVTYCIEGLMQDGKALQMGTSHDLGQNFAKAFDIKFLGRSQQQEYCWTTSWGMTTRLIGATIMVHSDDEGLVLPPRVAPDVAAIVPIYKSPEDEAKVRGFIDKLMPALIGRPDVNRVARHGIETYLFDPMTQQRIIADFRDARPGDKQYHWEQRGVPFRIEVGPRDVDAGTFVLKSRYDGSKTPIKLDEVGPGWLRARLDAAHEALFQRALKFREDNTRRANSYEELKKILAEHGGFVRCYFKPDRDNEARIKDDTKATVRCVPFDQPSTPGKDILTGEETSTDVLFAQAY
jgi:prolyl-tRNA synthetase